MGIGELCVSDQADTVLITYALGSCVAVVVHDPKRRVGGLLHYMLPQSKAMPEKAVAQPGMFADTGVPMLFHRLYAVGCHKRELVVKVVGGGHLLGAADAFDIGHRNLEVLDKVFARSGVFVAARDVGGAVSRTVELNVGTGRVTVRSHRKEHVL
ncbi:MAG: chemotaxis protein CheD [Archangiaceae bacterium]|nr:chemotaxis protein CheD [Archangiaceae bacterium]